MRKDVPPPRRKTRSSRFLSVSPHYTSSIKDFLISTHHPRVLVVVSRARYGFAPTSRLSRNPAKGRRPFTSQHLAVQIRANLVPFIFSINQSSCRSSPSIRCEFSEVSPSRFPSHYAFRFAEGLAKILLPPTLFTHFTRIYYCSVRKHSHRTVSTVIVILLGSVTL